MRNTKGCSRAAVRPGHVHPQKCQFSQAPARLAGRRPRGGPRPSLERWGRQKQGTGEWLRCCCRRRSAPAKEEPRQRHLHAAKAAQPVCATNPLVRVLARTRCTFTANPVGFTEEASLKTTAPKPARLELSRAR